MRELIVGKNEAGQRLDKLLKKYLKEAPGSFIYKMLRKKNIVLNEKKADGTEILKLKDSVKMYFSEETFNKMTGHAVVAAGNAVNPETLRRQIVYEDNDLLLLNKPSGWLSQSDGSRAVSANERILDYLMAEGKLTQEQLATFKPGIANRLDRNTSGLLVFGKSLPALQELARMLGERSLEKYYLCVVNGVLRDGCQIHGYLAKDSTQNRVRIFRNPEGDASEIHTAYEPLAENGKYTLLRVHLITGKTHQIRAHLSSIGHPLLGDEKYGIRQLNETLKKQYGVNWQLLHAYELYFPEKIEGVLAHLGGKHFSAPVPEGFRRFLQKENLVLNKESVV